MYVCIHTYTYIYMHTYINTYTRRALPAGESGRRMSEALETGTLLVLIFPRGGWWVG